MATTTKACGWGSCEAEATEIVLYPGQEGRNKCMACGSHAVHVCEHCAPIAREESAEHVCCHLRTCDTCMDTLRMIEALRVAAGAAGDEAQVELCIQARYGDAEAWLECVRVLDAGKVS